MVEMSGEHKIITFDEVIDALLPVLAKAVYGSVNYEDCTVKSIVKINGNYFRLSLLKLSSENDDIPIT